MFLWRYCTYSPNALTAHTHHIAHFGGPWEPISFSQAVRQVLKPLSRALFQGMVMATNLWGDPYTVLYCNAWWGWDVQAAAVSCLCSFELR